MLLESLKQMTNRWLRIPPGVSYSKAEHNSNSTSDYYYKDNEYLEAMVRITTDDICVSDTPFSVNYKQETPENIIVFLEQITDELNSVCKWITIDLLTEGYSLYEVKKHSENKEIVIVPYIEPVEFYLTDDMDIICYGTENLTKLEDVLLFINYDKTCISLVDDMDKKDLDPRIKFKVRPLPMQVNNVASTIRNLDMSEKSMMRYRTQLSRVARWVNVDIGASQGDLQQSVVDSISSAINTNSIDLTGTQPDTEYDDNIPVIPNRRGIGKPEIVESKPDYDMGSEVPDIDYFLGKLSLLMRFPESYLDFTKPLGETAVSLIRSDLRYYKLCSSVRTKIESTVNTYFSDTTLQEWDPYFSLTKLPSSEDDDVIEALNDYLDLVIKIDGFINEDSASLDVRINRFEQLQNLLNNSTNSPMIQSWLNEYREYLYSQAPSHPDEEEEGSDF